MSRQFPVCLHNFRYALSSMKKKKNFPWWCRIVAWSLLWTVTIMSAAFVTFYGISFADETCKKWITSMLLSLLMSIFVTQPFKVSACMCWNTSTLELIERFSLTNVS